MVRTVCLTRFGSIVRARLSSRFSPPAKCRSAMTESTFSARSGIAGGRPLVLGGIGSVGWPKCYSLVATASGASQLLYSKTHSDMPRDTVTRQGTKMPKTWFITETRKRPLVRHPSGANERGLPRYGRKQHHLQLGR